MSSAVVVGKSTEDPVKVKCASWVKLAHTWINLKQVSHIEEDGNWLFLYFRSGVKPCLLSPTTDRTPERLCLIGQEAEDLRRCLEQTSLSLTSGKDVSIMLIHRHHNHLLNHHQRSHRRSGSDTQEPAQD